MKKYFTDTNRVVIYYQTERKFKMKNEKFKIIKVFGFCIFAFLILCIFNW